MLSLTALELDGKKIAFDLSLIMRNTFFAYYNVFDENLQNLSPGKVIMAHLIERSFSMGLNKIDFSEGDEDYKREWTKTSRQYMEAYLLNRKSPIYLILLSYLLLRREAKRSPRLNKKIQKLKKHIRNF
jgi:CelD/BcsL family acetyltransferase involved in cellulose biosynthesis